MTGKLAMKPRFDISPKRKTAEISLLRTHRTDMTMNPNDHIGNEYDAIIGEQAERHKAANSHCPDSDGSTSCGWDLPFGIVKVQNIPLGKLHSSGYIHGNKADCKRAEKIAKKAHLLAKEIMQHTGESVQIIIKQNVEGMHK